MRYNFGLDDDPPTPADYEWAEKAVGWLYLGGAAVIGFVAGWFLHRLIG